MIIGEIAHPNAANRRSVLYSPNFFSQLTGGFFMSRKTLVAASAIVMLMSVCALANPKTGCQKFNFNGSFLLPNPNVDVFSDGTVVHSLAFQLTIHSDGTANQYWTGLPDFILNAGTGSPQIGSWTCRSDGKLIVNLIQGSYFPIAPGEYPLPVTPDVELISHSRTTYLFSVDDENTLTRIQSRTRSYQPNEDPTDPNGGHLLALRVTTATYKRLVATDTDLTAP
jgi:hypothetical protein